MFVNRPGGPWRSSGRENWRTLDISQRRWTHDSCSSCKTLTGNPLRRTWPSRWGQSHQSRTVGRQRPTIPRECLRGNAGRWSSPCDLAPFPGSTGRRCGSSAAPSGWYTCSRIVGILCTEQRWIPRGMIRGRKRTRSRNWMSLSCREQNRGCSGQSGTGFERWISYFWGRQSWRKIFGKISNVFGIFAINFNQLCQLLHAIGKIIIVEKIPIIECLI